MTLQETAFIAECLLMAASFACMATGNEQFGIAFFTMSMLCCGFTVGWWLRREKGDL